MDAEFILEIKNLFAGYTKGNFILKGLNLKLKREKTIAIVGRNGAGKSTLAKSILALTPYVSGSVAFMGEELINGKRYSPDEIAKKGVGYFMQGGEVFDNLTVQENLRFAGLKLDKHYYRKKLLFVNENFDLFKDSKIVNLKASNLSGGQKHQLALAMTLMQNPKLLILDEPSAGLSPSNREKIFKIIDLVRKELKLSVLLIEQNVDVAVRYADEIALLKTGIIEKKEVAKKIRDLEKLDEFFFGEN